MKQVYRMETAQGEGVFMTGAVEAYRDASGQNPGYMPTPCTDGIDLDYDIDFCGFDSIRQLRHWFEYPEHYHHLDERGILIRLYEVDDQHVKHGYNQVAFVRHLATIVAEEKPSQFASKLYNLL